MKIVKLLFGFILGSFLFCSCASIKNDRQSGGVNQPKIEQNIEIAPTIEPNIAPLEKTK